MVAPTKKDKTPKTRTIHVPLEGPTINQLDRLARAAKRSRVSQIAFMLEEVLQDRQAEPEREEVSQ